MIPLRALVLAAIVLIALPQATAQSRGSCRNRAELVEADVLVPAYDHGHGRDRTLSGLMRSVYHGERTSSYIAAIAEEQERSHTDVPLRDGEGREGYLFEANLDLFYTISSGRRASRFFEAGHRIGAYFNTTLRMTNDNSRPLLPANWKIGLAGELPIAISHLGRVRAEMQERITELRNLHDTQRSRLEPSVWRAYHDSIETEIRSERLRNSDSVAAANTSNARFLFVTWQVLHYSNGQDSGFYTDRTRLRNDYRTGDFSTNYVLVKLNYAYRYTGNMLSVGAGIRRDIGPNDSGIAFSKEQEHGYGRTRFVGHTQWRSKAFALWLPFGWNVLKRRFEDAERPSCTRKYRLREFAEFRARAEVDGILESKAALGNYPYAKKYRWGTHLWLELNTLRSYGIGFFVHGYHGRDYLNIRYDRVVWLFMGGVSFTFEKYIPYNWRAAQAILDP